MLVANFDSFVEDARPLSDFPHHMRSMGAEKHMKERCVFVCNAFEETVKRDRDIRTDSPQLLRR